MALVAVVSFVGGVAFSLGALAAGGAVTVGVLVLLAGCADPDPSSPTPDDLRAIDLSPDHTITIDDDGFSPADLEIDAGEGLVDRL